MKYNDILINWFFEGKINTNPKLTKSYLYRE